MADRAPCEVDEGAGNGEACGLRLRRFSGEQIVRRAVNAPYNRLWGHARLRQIAGRISPTLEVVLGRQSNAMSVDHRAFA
jgi:hypothetical protein